MLQQLLIEIQELRKELDAFKTNVVQPKFEGTSLDDIIFNTLISLHVPVSNVGYVYLKDAIKMVYEDFSLTGAITKELYPTIAKKYNTTSSRVERGIRHAIECSWYEKEPNFIKNYIKHRPTNSEFIAIVAEKLRLNSCEGSENDVAVS